ncbi:MAG: efflux RND transporter periplasmic adaptor subunit [Phycisphaerales bacterium]|nr:efflux RND transporter periplasmic adaptor subunit [Phycisphaerales bacterium]
MRFKLILILFILVGGGTLGLTIFGNDAPAFELETSEVESGTITMTVETLGTVEPLSTVQVGCETTGRIVEILADHDEPVKKDQIICRIDPELAEAQHQQSVAELNRAQGALTEANLVLDEQTANLPVLTAQALGRLEEAEAALLAEEYNWNRIDRLYQEKNASEAEWTQSKSRFKGAKAAVAMAKAAHDLAKNNEGFLIKRARAGMEQAKAAERLAQARFNTTKTQVDRCIIRSPIDGIVLKRYMDVGVTVNATFQTPPLFLIAPGLDRMRVNAKVSESDIIHIAVGQKARFTVEGKQRSEFEGTILHRRNQPEIVQSVVTYTVILEVDNDERRTLLPGMSVNVEIECVNKPNTMKIPNTVLRFKPPITLEERRALVKATVWPDPPQTATGEKVDYCDKTHAWQFDEATGQWKVIPLWAGVTDNIHTEIMKGAESGDRFVKKYIDKSSSGFSLKEAFKLASPENRKLL